MSGDTKERLKTALLRKGQSDLATLWEVDTTEVGRRLNGHRNIPLDDFCRALDELGIQLVTPDEHMIAVRADKYQALRVLARDALKGEEESDHD